MDGDKMRQANGPMDDKNGKMVIKDLAKAEWSDVFMLLDCAMIKAPIGRAVEVHGMIVKQQGN